MLSQKGVFSFILSIWVHLTQFNGHFHDKVQASKNLFLKFYVIFNLFKLFLGDQAQLFLQKTIFNVLQNLQDYGVWVATFFRKVSFIFVPFFPSKLFLQTLSIFFHEDAIFHPIFFWILQYIFCLFIKTIFISYAFLRNCLLDESFPSSILNIIPPLFTFVSITLQFFDAIFQLFFEVFCASPTFIFAFKAKI